MIIDSVYDNESSKTIINPHDIFCLAALKKTECEESLQKVYRDRKTLYLYLIYYLANCCIDLQ